MLRSHRLLTCCFYYAHNIYRTSYQTTRYHQRAVVTHTTGSNSIVARFTGSHGHCQLPFVPYHQPQLRTTMKAPDMNRDDEATNNVRLQKKLLRKEIRTKLNSLSHEAIAQQSRAVWDRLHAMTIYEEAKSIGLFLSMPAGEIDTSFAVQHAIECQKDIYIPQVGQNFELPDMELIQIQTRPPPQSSSSDPQSLPVYHHWPKNKWDIPEPPIDVILKTAQPGDIDVLILPGLAFDRCGNRLGQGKGYYDRFLARMCGGSNGGASMSSPILIAVALQCQFLGDDDTANNMAAERTIPVHEHDFPVHWIILPNQSIEVSKI